MKCENCKKEIENNAYHISLGKEKLWSYCSRVCIALDWKNYYDHLVKYGFIIVDGLMI